MADPTLRDVTWGDLPPDVARDLGAQVLVVAPRADLRVRPSYCQTIGGRETDVVVEAVTLSQVRELAAWLDERIASPAEETPGG